MCSSVGYFKITAGECFHDGKYTELCSCRLAVVFYQILIRPYILRSGHRHALSRNPSSQDNSLVWFKGLLRKTVPICPLGQTLVNFNGASDSLKPTSIFALVENNLRLRWLQQR